MTTVRKFPYFLCAAALSLAACSDSDPAVVFDGGTDAAADANMNDASQDSGATDASPMDGTTPTDSGADAGGDASTDAIVAVDANADMSIPVDMGDEDAAIPTGPCSAITDEMLRNVVYEGPRVPDGFYYEEPGEMAMFQWRTPCSDSLEGTVTQASGLFGADNIVSAEAFDKYYQADMLPPDTGGYHVLFRNTRCDYYDGSMLAGAPHETADALANLVSYIWFTENHDYYGSAIVSGEGSCDGEGCDYDLCTVQTVFGDFGLCDSITLSRQHYGVSTSGAVRFAAPVEVRTIDGTCHP